MAELGPENLKIEAKVERYAGHESRADLIYACVAAWEADRERIRLLEEVGDKLCGWACTYSMTNYNKLAAREADEWDQLRGRLRESVRLEIDNG